MPLQEVWRQTFKGSRDTDSAAILCRVELNGDAERIEGSLACARQELNRLCQEREAVSRQESRVAAAGVLSAAGFLIILLM